MREVRDSADSAALAAAMASEGDLVAERLERGCRAFAAWLDQELAAYGWLSTGPEWIGEAGLEIRPEDGEAYLWNCVTLPPHRLTGLFKLLVLSVAGTARSEGMTRLWIAGLEGTAERALTSFEPVAEITPEPGGEGWFRAEPAGLAVLGGAGRFQPGRPRRH